jgi:benzoyl-CoA reductase/2-hydroxyglutaryl-CoA dehydratase subunit BcrC/BadD/HgdB
MSQSNGHKKVGYFCVYTPAELISAAGAAPIRLFKGGSSIRVASGEVYVGCYFCQFPSYSVGAFREGDPLYKSVDKIYTFYTCDQMKKGVEAISEFSNVPSKILCLPRERKREASREFMLREVREFQADLEELTGQKVSEEGLRREIARYNCARRLLKQISELRKRENPPLSGGEFLELVKAFYYLPIEKSLAYYEDFYSRLVSEKGNGQRPIRIMMSGGIVADGDHRLIDLIERDLGARIVVEDHCTGLRPFYYLISEDGDPLQALADGYLDLAPCARMKPLEDRLDFSEKLALEYRVDAVIYVSLKFCSCYAITKNSVIKRFQKLGIPLLDISNDYSQSDLGQLRTRLEAFSELIKKGGGHVKETA